jgi:hypothetical protein
MAKLRRFVVTYTDSPGSHERFTWRTMAADLQHALDKFYDPDEGYVVIKVERETDHRSKVVNPIRRRGPNPRGKTPTHLKRFLFKKGHRLHRGSR